MTHTWPDGEPIQVVCDAGYRPYHFLWRHQRYRVQALHQRWQVDTDWWSEEGRVWRAYFVLTTVEGLLCVIYYDYLSKEWSLSRLYD